MKGMENELMVPRKNKKIKRSKASMEIAKAIIDEYKPNNAEEMQDALKDIFGPMFEALLQGEMDSHLGYGSNSHEYKATTNRRNETAVMKALYLRITELYKKWDNRPISNWVMVRNQLSMDNKIQARIMKYENYY